MDWEREQKGRVDWWKASRDNTNEDGWLRPVHPIYLIGVLLDEYLY